MGLYPAGMAAEPASSNPVLPDAQWLRDLIRDIPDYPHAGVTFRDITPLLGDATGFHRAVTELVDRFAGLAVDRVLGMEARGFILAAPVAFHMNAAFVPVRKAGKLPWQVIREEYVLEYGTDKLEIHRDAIRPGERILVIDDVLATGGTASATARLVEALGGEIVGLGFMIEIGDLNGRDKLGEHRVESLAVY
jgi:adenine phosphoribosyltransferase